MKKNWCLQKISLILPGLVFVLYSFVSETLAQTSRTLAQKNIESGEDFTLWYVSLFVLVAALIAAIFWKVKSQNKQKEQFERASQTRRNDFLESGSLDADKEMEWLRKNQNLVDKNRKRAIAKKNLVKKTSQIEDVPAPNGGKPLVNTEPAVLPVFSFEKLEKSAEYLPLPISQDEALLSAVEQAYDEYEEDEEVRDLAMRVLMAFKTRNSIEALSQMALYDLSSMLRSKAVVTLTEFDHESVFETILLACADPTREVRAAAARGLTRLSFNRADAWARIMETKEPGRIRQAARAAIESGFVQMSFDRLVHHDKQTAYEAFILLALLLRADETEPIFSALRNHKNMKVRLAILHLFKVTKDQNALNELYTMLEDKTLPEEIKAGVDKTIEEIGLALV